MPKTIDIPLQLREFNSLFQKVERRHDAGGVFDDFLTLVICCLARQTQEDWYLSTIRKYDEDEINIFPKMLGNLFIIYDKAIVDGYWTDPLGSFYEVIAGNYKRSGLGQFFTPAPLCNMIAQFTVPPGEFGKDILEPSCGSGRMILAVNQIAKGNHFTAIDLDHICVKMCCINLALHGVKATVLHADALSDKPPYNKYIINHDYHRTKTPFVFKIKSDE